MEYFKCLGYSGITDFLLDLADQILCSLIVSLLYTQILRFLGTSSSAKYAKITWLSVALEIVLSHALSYLECSVYLQNLLADFFLKEKFTPEWPFIFFTPIKSLYKNMLFTKISASNER